MRSAAAPGSRSLACSFGSGFPTVHWAPVTWISHSGCCHPVCPFRSSVGTDFRASASSAEDCGFASSAQPYPRSDSLWSRATRAHAQLHDRNSSCGQSRETYSIQTLPRWLGFHCNDKICSTMRIIGIIHLSTLKTQSNSKHAILIFDAVLTWQLAVVCIDNHSRGCVTVHLQFTCSSQISWQMTSCDGRFDITQSKNYRLHLQQSIKSFLTLCPQQIVKWVKYQYKVILQKAKKTCIKLSRQRPRDKMKASELNIFQSYFISLPHMHRYYILLQHINIRRMRKFCKL